MIDINPIMEKLISYPSGVHFVVTPDTIFIDGHMIDAMSVCAHVLDTFGFSFSLGFYTEPFKKPHGYGELSAKIKKNIFPDAQARLDEALKDLKERGFTLRLS